MIVGVLGVKKQCPLKSCDVKVGHVLRRDLSSDNKYLFWVQTWKTAGSQSLQENSK